MEMSRYENVSSNAEPMTRSHRRRKPLESRSVSSRLTPSAYGSSQVWVGYAAEQVPDLHDPGRAKVLAHAELGHAVQRQRVLERGSEEDLPLVFERVVDLTREDRVHGTRRFAAHR